MAKPLKLLTYQWVKAQTAKLVRRKNKVEGSRTAPITLLIENLDGDKRSAVDALIDDESHDLWDLSCFSLIFE